MSYLSRIHSEQWGTMWAHTTLRNWKVMGEPAEKCLARGPIFESVALGYLVCGSGRSVEESLASLVNAVDSHCPWSGVSKLLPEDKPIRWRWYWLHPKRYWRRWKVRKAVRGSDVYRLLPPALRRLVGPLRRGA